MKSIAVLGASADRSKFGNKCVRAYKLKGYNVFPVNPKEEEIEGLKCYKSITEISEKVDFISLYLPSFVSLKIVDEIIAAKPNVVYLNPGTESEELEDKLKEAGISVRKQCSIVALGTSPSEL